MSNASGTNQSEQVGPTSKLLDFFFMVGAEEVSAGLPRSRRRLLYSRRRLTLGPIGVSGQGTGFGPGPHTPSKREWYSSTKPCLFLIMLLKTDNSKNTFSPQKKKRKGFPAPALFFGDDAPALAALALATRPLAHDFATRFTTALHPSPRRRRTQARRCTSRPWPTPHSRPP